MNDNNNNIYDIIFNENKLLKTEIEDLKKILDKDDVHIFDDFRSEIVTLKKKNEKLEYIIEILKKNDKNETDYSTLILNFEMEILTLKEEIKKQNFQLNEKSCEIDNMKDINEMKRYNEVSSNNAYKEPIKFCNEFLKNEKCPHGNRCFYTHKSREWIDNNQPACSSGNNCSRGIICRFSHKNNST